MVKTGPQTTCIVVTLAVAVPVPAVTLQVWAGQVHAFPVLGNLLPESKAAIRGIATFIRGLLRPAEGDHPDLTALAG